VLSQSNEPVAVPLILRKQIHVRGIYVGSRVHFEAMNRALTQTRLMPVIDHVYPLEQARTAFETMESGSHFGKIVVRMEESA
jgi:D-arabinose 1-dehydrogenase-like Zn-dependent alcohol dehydrogenase